MIYTDLLIILCLIVSLSFLGFRYFMDWQNDYKSDLIRSERYRIHDAYDEALEALEDREWLRRSHCCKDDEEVEV